MNCQEYKDMIEDALDISLNGELEANIRRHLDHCAACREYLAMRRQEHAAVFAGVNAAYSHLRQPPADFADRVVREVAARRNARRGWRRLSLSRWALIAASVVVMSGFVFANIKLIMENGELEGGDFSEREETEATSFDIANTAAIDPSSSSVLLSASSVPSATTTGTQSDTNRKGETVMSKVKAAAAALTAVITTTPLASANGDEYQFIDPTTYPAANVSYSAQSSAITVDAGALRVASVPDDLEARSRTKGASAAILLDATKFCGTIISIY